MQIVSRIRSWFNLNCHVGQLRTIVQIQYSQSLASSETSRAVSRDWERRLLRDRARTGSTPLTTICSGAPLSAKTGIILLSHPAFSTFSAAVHNMDRYRCSDSCRCTHACLVCSAGQWSDVAWVHGPSAPDPAPEWPPRHCSGYLWKKTFQVITKT